jgi:hypothetical protein
MTTSVRLLPIAALLCAANVWGAPNEKSQHLGYCYPDGGQQGTVFEVFAGGQFLNGIDSVYVTGEGVHAMITQHGKPLNNKLLQEMRKKVMALLKERRAAQASGVASAPTPPPPAWEMMVLDHPLWRRVQKMDLPELEHWVKEVTNPNKLQMNMQLADMVLLQVTIDPGAALGDREIRFGTPNGLTNPLRFQVGAFPELCEKEPNDREASSLPPANLPVVLNGQIMPGDVDRFRFRAKGGQQLVMQAHARHLMPYLADAVPGWFQATLSLYDAKGNEVAFADDYRFDPDPVLAYKVPEDGEYDVAIHDAIYRGREDFVYRIAVGELPFITQMSPLGGHMGEKTVADIVGWNLPSKRLHLDMEPGPDVVRMASLHRYEKISNSVPYAVDTLPESREAEPNDVFKDAQKITLPQIINGCIGKPGDVDLFRFKDEANEEVVAETYARRLGSPLDSIVRLADESGKVLAWNDDQEDKETGLLTHHADSYLRTRLPDKGTYCVSVADTQHHGGEEYAYRLRISAPRPDFALRMTPSSINVPAGRFVPICVYALRKDGFDGDIEITLKDAPPGFVLNGGRIPGALDKARMTLAAPREALARPMTLQLEGHARIGEEMVSRPALPAEDMMQAFAYRHLTPSQQCMVAVIGGKRPAPKIELARSVPVRIPLGGAVNVLINAPKRTILQQIQLELSDPPKGIALQDLAVVPEGLTFTLKAEGEAIKPGLADNLIVEAFVENPGQPDPDKPAKQKQRVSFGVLPAIPFEIVQP